MEAPYRVENGIHVLSTRVPLGGRKNIAVNSYLVRDAEQPYLVDTTMVPEVPQYVDALSKLIDLKDLRWIFLTHDDADHSGAIHQVLVRAPNAKVITTSRTIGRLELQGRPLPDWRVYHLAAGEVLDLGDRKLTAFVPPFYDNPATTGAFDSKLRTVFSSDCFGAALGVSVELANEVPLADLSEAQVTWGSVEAPWLQMVERPRLEKTLKSLISLDPQWVMSGHLPPAKGLIEQFCKNVLRVPDAAPFIGRTQAANLAQLKLRAQK